MKTNDTLLVGFDFTNGGEAVDIINAFQGEEAEKLYNKLVTKIGEQK